MSIRIEKMRVEDYQDMISLWESLPGIGLSSADELDQISRFIEQNRSLCFVLRNNTELIGTILAGSDGRRGYIYHLAVNPIYQKHGFGKKLVEKTLTEFKAIGIQKVHIFVISDNQSGISFWKQIGWTLREDLLIMSREITDP